MMKNLKGIKEVKKLKKKQLILIFLTVISILTICGTTAATDSSQNETITTNNTEYFPDPYIEGKPGTYQKIQEAIDAATANDVIIVDSGNYNENIIFNKKIYLKTNGTVNIKSNNTSLPTITIGTAGTDSTIEGILNVTTLLVKESSKLNIAGGTTIYAENITITENSQIIAMGNNTGSQINGQLNGTGVTFNVGNLTIDSGSKITANDQGYNSATGAGPGAPSSDTRAGGSYGGYGGTLNNVGTATNAAEPYGNIFNPTELGSTGGYGDNGDRNAGAGGGAIIIRADKIILNGSITANGQTRDGYYITGGGGSGGSININTDQLTGSGSITANGGNGSSSFSGSGGGSGGRILVRYNTSTFTGPITANGGTGKQAASLYGDWTINGNGETGSVIYTTKNSLIINYDINIPQDSNINLNYDQVTVKNGAKVTIGGNSTITIPGKLTITENSQIICKSKNTAAQVNGTWAGIGVTFNVDDLIIDTGSKITADSQGYTPYNGPGAKGPSSDQGNSGGTYAGIGGNGGQWGAASTNTYGNPYQPTDLGSGGGAYDNLGGGSGGSGGGAIKINVANNLQVDGSITANGENKDGRGSGAGSGGSLYILTRNLLGTGTISTNGGSSLSNRGGGGGGGRIAIYYENTTFNGTTTATGGTGANFGTSGTIRLVKSTAASLLNSKLVEISSDVKTWNDILISKTANITGIPASGTLNGTLDITNLEMVKIANDPLKNSGFAKGKWNATLDSVTYQGDLTGMFYLNGGVLIFKGTTSGDIIGTIEAQLTENETGTGQYNILSGIWKLSTFSDNPISDILTLDSTTVTYGGETQYPNTQLTLLQTNIQGTAAGQYSGQLSTVLNHLVVSDINSPYYGKGFSTLSYISTEGSGSGWTYDHITEPQKTELNGLFNGPLSGIVTGVLDESTTPRSLNLQIGKTDAGLPAMADVEVKTSGPGRVSPGQTIDYIVEYWNRGVINAENVTIYDLLSSFVEYISNTGNGTYEPDFHRVKFQLGTLTPGQKGAISIKCRVIWGIPFGWTWTNNALIGTDSPEIDAYLDPENTALTPEWWNEQIAYAYYLPGNTPPTYDPTDRWFDFQWQNVNPAKIDLRINQAIQTIKNLDPQMGALLEKYKAEGKIKIDDLPNGDHSTRYDSGLKINARDVGAAQNGGDRAIPDSKWDTYSQTGVFDTSVTPNILSYCNPSIRLIGFAIHEGEHSQQVGAGVLPGGAKGERRAFDRECMALTKIMIKYRQNGDHLSAQQTANWIAQRWYDIMSRTDPNKQGGPEINNLDLHNYAKTQYDRIRFIENNYNYISDEYLTYYLTSITNDYIQQQTCWDNIWNDHYFGTVTINARDPNILYGPEGYVLPGDTLNYTVECENVGEGTAYGVYITDTLDPDLDASTLQIGPVKSTVDNSTIAPAGVYDSNTRTITWQVGELGSYKGAYAEYSVKLRSDATDGTSVINYATVYFPSVPEETPTNAIVSIVDLTPPEVTINNPVNGSNIPGVTIINATATDVNPVVQIVFEIKNISNIIVASGTDTNGTDGWTYSWNPTNLPTGNYTIAVTATDEAGNPETKQIIVHVLADVYANATFSKTDLKVGETTITTVKVGNNGPGKGTDVVLTYQIPEGMEFVSASIDPVNLGTWTYNETTRTVTWNIGEVLVGDPYLYVTQRALQTGIFTSPFSLSSISTLGLTITNNVSAPVTVSTQQDSNNPSNQITTTEVNALTTSEKANGSTIPMQNTGLPIGAAFLALLMILCGLYRGKKEK